MELRYRDSGDESVGRHEGLGAVCCPNSPMSRSRWSGNDQRGECVARWPDPGRVDDPRGRLGAYRFGRPLLVEEMRFSRSDSAEAIALCWLAVGVPPSERLADGMVAVEAFCDATGYPATSSTTGSWAPLICCSGSAAAIITRWADCWPVRFPLFHRRRRSRTPARPCGAGRRPAGPGVAHPRNSSAHLTCRSRQRNTTPTSRTPRWVLHAASTAGNP